MKPMRAFNLEALLSYSFLFSPVFFVPYFLELGFSLSQIGILLAVSPLASLLSEIPTGTFADLYGRKNSVLLGYFFQMILFMLVPFASAFSSLLLLFLLMGIATTFISGALEAWVIDTVPSKQKLHPYFTTTASLINVGLLISGFLGAFFVARFGLVSIWYSAAFSNLIGIGILAYAPEKRQKRKNSDRFLSLNKKAIVYSFKDKRIRWFIILGSLIMAGGYFTGNITWTPLLKEQSFPDYAFGYLWSATALFAIFAQWVAKKIHSPSRELALIKLFLILSGIISLFILYSKTLVMSLLLIFANGFFFDLKRPLLRNYFHSIIPSKMRASIGSVESMVTSLVFIVISALIGFIIESTSATITFALGGIILLIAAVSLSKVRKIR